MSTDPSSPGRAMSRILRPSGRQIVDIVAAASMVMVAVHAFESSFGGGRYLVVGGVGVVLGLIVGHVTSSLRWTIPLALAASTAVHVVVGGVVAFPSRATSGLLPNPDTMWGAGRTVVTGWMELVTTAPPVGDIGDLMAIPMYCGLAGAMWTVVLGRMVQSSFIVAVPPSIVLGLGIVTGTSEPVSVLVHGAVFAGLAVAAMASREHVRRPLVGGQRLEARRLVGAAVMLGVACAAGFGAAERFPVVNPAERVIWRETVTPPFDPLVHPSPLAGYRQYVKVAQTDPRVMFTVEGIPKGVPVRLATMDAYDGLVWQVSAGEQGNPSLADSGSFERVGTDIPPDYGGPQAEVTVVIGQYADVWVPNVGEVLRLRFEGSTGGSARDRQLNEEFRYNRATDTAATRLRLQEGDRYVMTVVLPTMKSELEAEPIELQVPRLGPVVRLDELGQAFGGEDVLEIDDTGTRLDRVAKTMAETGTYSDGDLAAEQQGSAAGHSAHRLRAFVANYPSMSLIGNAEQYVAAYALLFRGLGPVPTRVVMGFMPELESTDEPVDVEADDIEAWVEVPVRDVGWVAIFPTPPRDQQTLTTSRQTSTAPEYRTPDPPPPPVIDPEFEQASTSKGSAAPTGSLDTPEVTSPSILDSLFSNPIVIAIGVALLPVLAVIAVGAVFAGLKSLRRRRRRASPIPHHRVIGAWKEITDRAIDLGRPMPANVTRREAGGFISPGAIDLAVRADAVIWSPGEPSDEEVRAYWSALEEMLGDLRGEVGLLGHLRAVMSPRSLRLGRRVGRPTLIGSTTQVWKPVQRVGARRKVRATPIDGAP